MFSSINFLFLISLAITSWLVLCYFNHIEESRVPEINVEFTMEKPYEEALIPSTTCRLLENYDIYLNFLCIFACIYALAKVTQLTEEYIAKQVSVKFGHQDYPHALEVPEDNGDSRVSSLVCQGPPLPPLPPQGLNLIATDLNTIEDYRARQRKLLLLITQLRKQNADLERQLKESSEAPPIIIVSDPPNTGDQSDHFDPELPLSQSGDAQDVGNRPNIFITNRHFHLNRQVYMNEGNVKLKFQDFNKEGGDFTQIWQKYLEMQKYGIKKPATSETPKEVANNMPVVISTEELQTIQGLF